eukprot:TRINITY_DN38098_c0_g1_i1.p1 TRINITY_DN38098_c0_g1~~TRINITY_DN38098_c0_g1_i1.p1  ORF type:complete len:235 (-),score=36.27 TRINITY_DN38098_c0_g1_i1:63-740(-)
MSTGSAPHLGFSSEIQLERLSPKLAKALNRLDESTRRSSYGRAFCHHESLRQPTSSQPSSLSSTRCGRHAPQELPLDSKKAERRNLKDRHTTTYMKQFRKYGDDEFRPSAKFKDSGQAGPLPDDVAHAEEVKAKREEMYWSDIRKARELEDSFLNGFGLTRDLKIKLVAPSKPPGTEIHSNYVGGLPPIYWKSEMKSNLLIGFHSPAQNSKYLQPQQIAVLAKYK